MLTLLLSGCTTNSSSQKESNSSSKTSTRTVKTSYFQNLSSSAKRDVKFTFKLNQDDTEDNTADPVYVVSATIKNNTNKNIKFDQSKFICVLPSNKIISDKTGTLTIKAGETKSINQLFQKMPEQGTLGDGYIEYLNSDNKLAYTNFIKGVALSSNLTDKKLVTKNQDVNTNSKFESDSSDGSSDTNTSNSKSLTESQARKILGKWADSNGISSFSGSTLDELTGTEDDNNGWHFTAKDGTFWLVLPNGKIALSGQ